MEMKLVAKKDFLFKIIYIVKSIFICCVFHLLINTGFYRPFIGILNGLDGRVWQWSLVLKRKFCNVMGLSTWLIKNIVLTLGKRSLNSKH